MNAPEFEVSPAPCPICARASYRRFRCEGHWLRECSTCQHQFFELTVGADHVSVTYDDSYFNSGGAGYPDYLGDADLLRRRGRWYAKKLSRYTKTGTLLDVGAAAGFILKGFEDAGWRGEGIEPNETMARHARDVLGLRVATAQLETYPGGRRFDLVAMIQVIAHLADPLRAMSQIAGLLEPGGHLLVETWNCKSLTARLLGSRWHEYSPPSVLHCFSDRSLTTLAERTGFHEIFRGRPSKWISVRHAKALLRHKYGDVFADNAVSRLVPNRLRFPYPSEDLSWTLFRSS